MAIPRIDLTYRNIQRYRQIINVLLVYGFGQLVERLELGAYGQFGRRIFRRRSRPFETLGFAVRLRMVFEELGPTFVKLGQVLALQAVDLPEELLEELSKLHDRAPQIHFSHIRAIVERSLGRPLDETFAEFQEEALAAASIAQVHRAVLKNGEEVVVKVRRPGVDRLVRTDMGILKDLARLAARHVPELRRYDPEGIVDQLANTMLKELDFRYEARNCEIFARNMRTQEGIYVPRVYGELVTPEVLVVEFIHGIKISEVDRLQAEGHDLRRLARIGTDAILTQVFRDGFFHADPHPGNIFVTPEGCIAPVDFGLMGRLDPDLMRELAGLLIGLVRRDTDAIVAFFLRTGGFPDDVEPPRFRLDVIEFLDRWHGVELGRLDITSLGTDLIGALNRNDVRPRPELVLLLKTLMMHESVGRRLDPELDLVEAARPFLIRIVRARYDPARIGKRSLEATLDYAELARVLPQEVIGLTRRLRTGKQSLVMRHAGLDEFRVEMERSSNRLTLGLVVSALVLASTVLLTAGPGPTVGGFPLLGVLGFAAAGVTSLWLIVGILRSGRL